MLSINIFNYHTVYNVYFYVGTLSMYSFEKNQNASQFLITFKPLRTLDGNHVVFGRVIRGLTTLKLVIIKD